jgi:hypothetical protein
MNRPDTFSAGYQQGSNASVAGILKHLANGLDVSSSAFDGVAGCDHQIASNKEQCAYYTNHGLIPFFHKRRPSALLDRLFHDAGC